MASTSLLRRAVAAAPVPAARARRLRRGARRRGRGRGVGRGGGATAAADDADASSSSWDDGDTIAAIATPVVPQAGGVAIIRLSGPNAVAATRAVFRPAAKAERDAQRRGDPMVSHTALYGDVRDPRDGKVIDEVLVLPMLAPRSYTTEDVVEIHAHGGSVCVQRVLALLLRNGDETFERSDAGRGSRDDDEKEKDAEEPVPRAEKSFVRVRLARPGEFTLRAFLNGRLDLTQAEAVHGLVSARTAAAADGALSALRGGLAGPVRRARREAVELLAELEARLDFDDALEPLDETHVSVRVSRLRDAVRSVLNTAERGRLRETGVSVAIVGRPNAGKSSLLNAWSRSDKAIVTDIAGTTRDVVEASVVVAGVPVTLLDTAGIRSDTRGDAVEAIGVERSLAAAKGADAVLMVVDARSGWVDEDREVWERLVDVNASKNESEKTVPSNAFEDSNAFGKNEFENARARLYATRGGLERFANEPNDSNESNDSNDSNDAFSLESSVFSETALGDSSSKRSFDSERRVPLLLALNKIDAVPEKERAREKADVPRDVLDAAAFVVETSATTRAGLDALETALAAFVGAGEIDAEGAQWAANQRQAEALRVAEAALERLAETVEDGLPVDFWTIELREAAAALGEITGEDVAEDVLDVVFTKFCIGK
jgi:tRNA modification GTPase